jgi:hypothetical protein
VSGKYRNPLSFSESGKYHNPLSFSESGKYHNPLSFSESGKYYNPLVTKGEYVSPMTKMSKIFLSH